MKSFDLYFEYLTEDAQKYLCELWHTSPEDENWKNIPLTVLDRELDRELERVEWSYTK